MSAYGSVVARRDGSRVFAVFIQNVNDVANLPGKPPSSSFRSDMLGNFVSSSAVLAGGGVYEPCCREHLFYRRREAERYEPVCCSNRQMRLLH